MIQSEGKGFMGLKGVFSTFHGLNWDFTLAEQALSTASKSDTTGQSLLAFGRRRRRRDEILHCSKEHAWTTTQRREFYFSEESVAYNM